MAEDWYTKARNDFMQDLWSFNEVSPEDAQTIYSYLVNVGLIDYDVEKDFLWDEYVEDEDKDD